MAREFPILTPKGRKLKKKGPDVNGALRILGFAAIKESDYFYISKGLDGISKWGRVGRRMILCGHSVPVKNFEAAIPDQTG